MISPERANDVVAYIDAAREWATDLTRGYNDRAADARSEANLISNLRTAADSFGLELVPKSDREQKENIVLNVGCGVLSGDLAVPPRGVNPKDAIGAAKVPMGYFPPAALLYATLALWNGDVKYDKYNWREDGKILASIYIDAVERHLGLWKSGEDIDPKSGVPHLGHVLAGLAILIDALEGGYLVDDRPKNQYDFGALLDKWNAQGPVLVKRWQGERAERQAKTAVQ